MRFDKFTIKSQVLIQNSQNLAARHNNPQIEPEHLLGAMLTEAEGIVNSMLKLTVWLKTIVDHRFFLKLF
jgi:ATP-dependent Clp protease ATP-binding subunit ClpB